MWYATIFCLPGWCAKPAGGPNDAGTQETQDNLASATVLAFRGKSAQRIPFSFKKSKPPTKQHVAEQVHLLLASEGFFFWLDSASIAKLTIFKFDQKKTIWIELQPGSTVVDSDEVYLLVGTGT
eukprot:GHVU01092869.1.p1 GENE.GHVU01092869.1~~GHVU01092869.1.p1  ORF type:complete len:124 (-),score=11.38 GHVU01092869.1:48-419(-)